MKKLFLAIVWGMIVWLLDGCESYSGDLKNKRTLQARKAFQYVEDDLQSIAGLFENMLKLDQEMQRGIEGEGASEYFPGEKVFREANGWWGVNDWHGCRFKIYGLNSLSLTTVGAQWTAISRYYSSDSLFVECLGPGRWSVKGFTRGSNCWRTEVSGEFSLSGNRIPLQLDSLRLIFQGNGVTSLAENYPASDVKITFSTPQPLQRLDRLEYRPYPFMGGCMQLYIHDLRKDRKEQAFVEIEDLPMSERLIRITARGVTEIY